MTTGFSIYEALQPYAGRVGVRLSRAALDDLVYQIMETLRTTRTQRVLARLEPGAALTVSGGILFAQPAEQPSALPPGWQTHRLAPDDALVADRFIVSDSDGLPIVLLARQRGAEFFALLSIDEPLVENARAILTQYHGSSYTPIIPNHPAMQASGRLVVTLKRAYGAELISSWVNRALLVTGGAQLNELRQAIGAVSMRWHSPKHDLTVGSLPPSLTRDRTNDGIHQLERVTLPDGTVFEAAGMAGDTEFAQRCHVCIGVLAATESDDTDAIKPPAASAPPAEPEAEIKQVNFDFSLDQFMESLHNDADSDTTWPPLAETPAAPEESAPPTDPAPSAAPAPAPPSVAEPTDDARADSNLPDDWPPADFDASEEAPAFLKDWPPAVDDETDAGAPAAGLPPAGNGTPNADLITAVSADDAGSGNIAVPDAGVALLSYVNREISFLRDRILDIGLAQSLAQQPRDALNQFVNRSGDLLLLIDEVVYMQRMVEQVQASLESLEPHVLLGSLVITYAGEAERRGVDLTYDAPEELPSIQGNAEALNRALVIILERAIEEAAPRGRVEIGAALVNNDALEFFVRDTGQPLDDSAMTDLFRPRFLTDDNASGLGFAALVPIAEAHYGTVQVKRENALNVIALRLPMHTRQPKN
ncbi:MAG: HAMP domain-containing histidine kinase [Chloroflexi bacterium]|nr:HAMP domain-containing histidine kinase [Chloroflexota bacterium]